MPQRGIVPAVRQRGLSNGEGAATVLDGFIRGGRSGSDRDAVVTALGRLPTDKAVAVATGQTMPALHGNAAQVGMHQASIAGEAIARHLANRGSVTPQPEGEDTSDRSLWVKPLSNWLDQHSVDGASGYKINAQGIVAGAQANLDASASLGLALACVASAVQGKGFAASHTTDIESVQLTGYGQHALGAGPWNLVWQAGYARSQYESARALGFIGRIARARYSANAWQLGLGVNRAYVYGATTMRPEAKLDWRRLNARAYTESGAAALDLNVGAQTAQETRLTVGAQVLHEASHQWQWLASAALGYGLQRSGNNVTAQFSGGGAAFTTAGLSGERTSTELGAGIRYMPSKTTELTARYDIALTHSRQNQSASLRFGWLF